MGAAFDGTSTGSLNAAFTPISGYPMSFMCWTRPTVTPQQAVLLDINDGSDTSEFILGHAGAGFASATSYALLCENASNTSSVVTIGTPVAGAWAFVLAECRSATNRRLSVINPTGATVAVQDTVSILPTALSSFGIGQTYNAGGFGSYAGTIAEVSVLNDVIANGAAIDKALLYQIAYRGVWSVPALRGKLTYYAPLYQTLNGTAEGYYQGNQPAIWTPGATCTLSQFNPPLSPGYQRPGDFTRIGDI